MTRRTSSDTKRAATRLIWALSHRTTQSAMRMLSPVVVLACLLPCCREQVQSDSAEAGVSGTTPASEADSHAGGDRHLPIIRRAAYEVSMNRELGMDLLGRLPGLSNAELNALLEAVNARTNEVQAWLFEKAVCELAKRDPWSALKWFDEIKDTPYALGGFDIVTDLAAANDPARLVAWFKVTQGSVPGELAGVFADNVFGSLASHSPVLALENLADISDPAGIHRATNSVFAVLATQDLENARKLALAGYRGAQLDSILSSMAGSIGLEDPRKGLELAAGIGDIQARSGVVAEIIGRLAQADPREALAQLELLSVRDLQHVLTRSSGLHGSSIIEDMARTNTDAMLKLVNKLPLTDRTLEVFSRAISTATGDDVSRAYEMIVSFPPGDTRNRLMERYAQMKDTAGLSKVIDIASRHGDTNLLHTRPGPRRGDRSAPG